MSENCFQKITNLPSVPYKQESHIHKGIWFILSGNIVIDWLKLRLSRATLSARTRQMASHSIINIGIVFSIPKILQPVRWFPCRKQYWKKNRQTEGSKGADESNFVPKQGGGDSGKNNLGSYLFLHLHLGKYFIINEKIRAKIHEIGKIKVIFGLGMTPL